MKVTADGGAMRIQFGEFRRYISIVDRISICIRETSQYNNYQYINDVPTRYDDYFVYGIGLVDSDFPINEQGTKCTFKGCIEIVLTLNPYF